MLYAYVYKKVQLHGYLGFSTETKQETQVIKFNKKFPDSVNMTRELYSQGAGFLPSAQELKSLFYFDASYREMICRKRLQSLISRNRRSFNLWGRG